MNRLIGLIFLSILIPFVSNAQTDASANNSDNDFFRAYSICLANKYDVLNSTENFRTGLKLLNDIWYRGLEKRVQSKFLKNLTGFTVSFTIRWFSMLWPHEYGHWLRTHQAGGEFIFDRFMFPGIISQLSMPVQATPEQHCLALIGGFEANSLSSQQILDDFYRNNGLFNDEYGMGFGHRIMYPLYAFLFSRQNPKDTMTWIKSGGDPVNFTKLVWEFGNRDLFGSDKTVNPELIKFYQLTAIGSVLWNLLDINFYRQASAYFGNELNGKKPLIFKKNNFYWGYSTFFNTSVLGSEFYLNNYFLFHDKRLFLYIRSGFPLKNIGFGLSLPDIVRISDNLKFDLIGELWDQYNYGKGFSVSGNIQFKIGHHWQLMVKPGYKTEGYLLGKTTQSGFHGLLNFAYILFPGDLPQK